MSKDKDTTKKIAGTTIDPKGLKTSYPVKRLIGLLFIMAVLLAVAILSFIYKEYVCSVGMVIFDIYVSFITFIQKSSDYTFEFVPEAGLKGFKVYYKEKELKLEYKLDRNGRFMWENEKKPFTCIGYADNSTMNKYITKYRVLNHINVVLEQNGLYSDHAW